MPALPAEPGGPPAPTPIGPGGRTFPRRQRLAHARQFQAVYRRGVRRSRHPLTVHLLPNDLPYPRLGLAVGRGVGRAVARNRVKRLVRESFRLEQRALPGHGAGESPGSFDLVVSVRPHDSLTLAECRSLLVALVAECVADLRRRAPRRPRSAPP